MKTYYLPDTAAVDIFDIEANVEADETLTGTVMKNATEPFVRQDEGTEKSGVLKDWKEYTPNLLTQNGGRTGTFYEASAGKTFINMSTLNYDSAIENGKIWQKVTLPAGTYEFSFNVNTSRGIIWTRMALWWWQMFSGYRSGSGYRFGFCQLGAYYRYKDFEFLYWMKKQRFCWVG